MPTATPDLQTFPSSKTNLSPQFVGFLILSIREFQEQMTCFDLDFKGRSVPIRLNWLKYALLIIAKPHEQLWRFECVGAVIMHDQMTLHRSPQRCRDVHDCRQKASIHSETKFKHCGWIANAPIW